MDIINWTNDGTEMIRRRQMQKQPRDGLRGQSLIQHLKRGQKIVQWTKKYQTKEVSTTPRHELSFFQNLEIPDGTLVYEIENRKIIKSYKKGSAKDPESADAPSSP